MSAQGVGERTIYLYLYIIISFTHARVIGGRTETAVVNNLTCVKFAAG